MLFFLATDSLHLPLTFSKQAGYFSFTAFEGSRFLGVFLHYTLPSQHHTISRRPDKARENQVKNIIRRKQRGRETGMGEKGCLNVFYL